MPKVVLVGRAGERACVIFVETTNTGAAALSLLRHGQQEGCSPTTSRPSEKKLE